MSANSLNSGHLYFVALRDQEDGGSNPLAPTISFAINNLQSCKVVECLVVDHEIKSQALGKKTALPYSGVHG